MNSKTCSKSTTRSRSSSPPIWLQSFFSFQLAVFCPCSLMMHLQIHVFLPELCSFTRRGKRIGQVDSKSRHPLGLRHLSGLSHRSWCQGGQQAQSDPRCRSLCQGFPLTRGPMSTLLNLESVAILLGLGVNCQPSTLDIAAGWNPHFSHQKTWSSTNLLPKFAGLNPPSFCIIFRMFSLDMNPLVVSTPAVQI